MKQLRKSMKNLDCKRVYCNVGNFSRVVDFWWASILLFFHSPLADESRNAQTSRQTDSSKFRPDARTKVKGISSYVRELYGSAGVNGHQSRCNLAADVPMAEKTLASATLLCSYTSSCVNLDCMPLTQFSTSESKQTFVTSGANFLGTEKEISLVWKVTWKIHFF